uniref:(California timema) hypothetical protein n=1 Tax=Timema californicum TaxID=61474 RepID=A0A7R9PAX8_TIMCA|nr:unnamed protein product [Timema californicum]
MQASSEDGEIEARISVGGFALTRKSTRRACCDSSATLHGFQVSLLAELAGTVQLRYMVFNAEAGPSATCDASHEPATTCRLAENGRQETDRFCLRVCLQHLKKAGAIEKQAGNKVKCSQAGVAQAGQTRRDLEEEETTTRSERRSVLALTFSPFHQRGSRFLIQQSVFKYTNPNKKVDVVSSSPNIQLLTLSCQLSLQLSFDPQTSLIKVPKSPYATNILLGLPSQMYIHTNILDPQPMGDIVAPLLRIVGINNINYLYGIHKTVSYTPMHYMPVLTRGIENLQINISTNTGEPVPFEFGKHTRIPNLLCHNKCGNPLRRRGRKEKGSSQIHANTVVDLYDRSFSSLKTLKLGHNMCMAHSSVWNFCSAFIVWGLRDWMIEDGHARHNTCADNKPVVPFCTLWFSTPYKVTSGIYTQKHFSHVSEHDTTSKHRLRRLHHYCLTYLLYRAKNIPMKTFLALFSTPNHTGNDAKVVRYYNTFLKTLVSCHPSRGCGKSACAYKRGVPAACRP